MQMAMAPMMMPHAQVHGYGYGYQEEPPMLYPPTPFSTPPSSPRASFSASAWDQPESKTPPSPPPGPSSSAVSNVGENAGWIGRGGSSHASTAVRWGPRPTTRRHLKSRGRGLAHGLIGLRVQGFAEGRGGC